MNEPSNEIVIRTVRLTLRPCIPEDCADFIALEQDPEVMRYLNGGHPVDRTRCTGNEGFMMPDGTEPHIWTARLNATETFVGWFGLWHESETLGSLGYRLGRAYWHQGLAPEGARALIDWGFKTHDYETIEADTMFVNHGSRRVMEKIGMKHVRTYAADWPEHIEGKELGDVDYALTRESWKAC